jgi:hypothetical protein
MRGRGVERLEAGGDMYMYMYVNLRSTRGCKF